MTDNLIESANINEMTIQQLRAYASHMNIALDKTATKEQIIKTINARQNLKAVPKFAEDGDRLKPGYAKIRILEDSAPGAENYPVYLNCNGYQCTIPRGKDVIVPLRVVRTLNDAIVKKRKQVWVADPATGRESMRETVVPSLSYPFQVLEYRDGPELLTPLEAQRQKIMAPRKRYLEKFGHYPKRGELKRAIEQGFIKLNPETEALSDAEESVSLIQE